MVLFQRKILLDASPSDATSLSVWEISYLLSRVPVSDVMTKDVFTLEEDTPIEEAAMIMVDNELGGLPVTRGKAVVGLITETDLFKCFLELMGARELGVRVTAIVVDEPGVLAKITNAITSTGAISSPSAHFLAKIRLIAKSFLRCRTSTGMTF